jgi:hypothetical protein
VGDGRGKVLDSQKFSENFGPKNSLKISVEFQNIALRFQESFKIFNYDSENT